MAHERKRHFQHIFNKLLSFSPIVAVFGHRQVGKSTFIAANVKKYFTFDDQTTLELVKNNPKQFISKIKNHPAALDECQIEPRLFPTLKEQVRIKKKPGQFVLSGSVRFTSRKAIRESLAGRMSFFEVLPFDIQELGDSELSEFLFKSITLEIFSSNSNRQLNDLSRQRKNQKLFDQYLLSGGLPGLCFIRDKKIREDRFNDLISLILDRDLRMVLATKLSLKTLREYLSYVAQNPWVPYNSSEVKRKFGLAPQTQKNLLAAFEGIFLIRRIGITQKKTEVILLEDQYEEYFFSLGKNPLIRQIEGALYRNIRTQFMYRLGNSTEFEYFETRNGARVPIVIKNEGKILGLIVIDGEAPSISETRSAASFLKHYGNSKVIYLTKSISTSEILNNRSLQCSLYAIL